VVERVIDLVFVEMEKKVVDLHFELELEVIGWFEGSIVVEKLAKVADIVDIENIFHKDFSILDSNIVVEPKGYHYIGGFQLFREYCANC